MSKSVIRAPGGVPPLTGLGFYKNVAYPNASALGSKLSKSHWGSMCPLSARASHLDVMAVTAPPSGPVVSLRWRRGTKRRERIGSLPKLAKRMDAGCYPALKPGTNTCRARRPQT